MNIGKVYHVFSPVKRLINAIYSLGHYIHESENQQLAYQHLNESSRSELTKSQ